jgi:regulation of enolase protein 1 (concanavalin A-like superfamily)
MKSIFSYNVLLTGMVIISGCDQQKASDNKTATSESSTQKDSAAVKGTLCDKMISGVHFTRSINNADSLTKVDPNGKVTFSVGAKRDYFCDPNDNKLSNNTAPILLSNVDNTKAFTFISKVAPGFTNTGLYNAGVLYIYVNDNFWQKLCFEQDERGHHRIVSVRTIGTSDDNNHDVVTDSSVYMKISSDTRTIASYYSTDKKNWHLVRLYKNNYPEKIWVGFSAQCPIDTGTVSHFEDISLDQQSVKDFRLGN